MHFWCSIPPHQKPRATQLSLTVMGNATVGLFHLALTPPSSLQFQAALHLACHGQNRSHRGEGMLSLGNGQLSFLQGIQDVIFPVLCMAERRVSCHRDTQEGLSPGALSSQGSSKLRKLQKTKEEKPERTEKGITWKLKGRTEIRKPYVVL